MTTTTIRSVAECLERLVLNGIEADAREVSCELSLSSSFQEQRPSWIRVRDDGEGMTEKDLHLVGEYGCTSKRGKRGASLASIVERASRVQIVTRKRMGGGMTSEASPSTRTFSATLSSSGSRSTRKVKGMQPSAYRTSGTIVTVHDLF